LDASEFLGIRTRVDANKGLVVVASGVGIGGFPDVLRALALRVSKLILVDCDKAKMDILEAKLDGSGVAAYFIIGKMEDESTYTAIEKALGNSAVDVFSCDLSCSSLSGNRFDLKGRNGLDVDLESGLMLCTLEIIVGRLSRRFEQQRMPFAFTLEEIVPNKITMILLRQRLSRVAKYALQRETFTPSTTLDDEGFKSLIKARPVNPNSAIRPYVDTNGAVYSSQARLRSRFSSSEMAPLSVLPAPSCAQDCMLTGDEIFPLSCKTHTVTKDIAGRSLRSPKMGKGISTRKNSASFTCANPSPCTTL
jgi:hypothetical protein